MVCRVALVACIVLGACAPSEDYSGPAHVMLDWMGQLKSGVASAMTYSRKGRDFALEASWRDEDLGEIRVSLFREGDAVGKEVLIGGAPCAVKTGGLVLDGVQKPNPVVFTGACQRDDKTLAFRFAFTPDRDNSGAATKRAGTD